MAKFNEYERINPRDNSLRGVERMYARVQRGYEDSEKAEPGRATFNPASVQTRQGLIGEDVYDQRHPAYQKPQDRLDRQGPKYDNDCKGWVAGTKGERSCYQEDGTGYPGGGFDHRDPKTGMPKKWNNT